MSMVPYPPPPPPTGPVDNPGRLPTVGQDVLMLSLVAVYVFLAQFFRFPIALSLTVVIAAARSLLVHVVWERLQASPSRAQSTTATFFLSGLGLLRAIASIPLANGSARRSRRT